MATKQRKSPLKKKTLKQLYAEHKGKVSDKWSAYLTEYEEIFKEYRSKPVRLLEIGVQNGGSLEIWSKFFPKAQKFVGCDINRDCARLSYEDPRIALIIGDANADAVQIEILGHAPAFDIIIDDGSHRSSDIIRSFARYFPYLTEGGVYVVEDLHCSYWREYEGGLYDPFSSITFFKRLADTINQEHWGIGKSRTDLLAGFFSKYSFHMAEEALRAVHSIQLINSLCIIRKKESEQNELGIRTVAGLEEMVFPGLLGQHSSHGASSDQSGNEWTARSMPPDEELPLRITELAEREERIANLSRLVSERNEWLSSLNQTITERDGQITRLTQSMSERDQQITRFAQLVTERDEQITRLTQSVAEHDEQIASLSRIITERDAEARELGLKLREQETQASDLEMKAQQVPVLQSEVRRQREELRTLTAFTEKLNAATLTIFNSLTWRAGYFAAELVRKTTLRRKEPLIQDHIHNLRAHFFSWKSSYFQRQKINGEGFTSIPEIMGYSEHQDQHSKEQQPKERKIAIAALVTTRGDGEPSGSAYIRLIQPLTHPAVKNKLLITICRFWEELITLEVDIILIQRNALPDLESAQAVADYCREKGIRLIYEVDDDLLSTSNKGLKGSYSKASLEAAEFIIKKADRIITSSQPLQEQTQAINPCVSYIPNAIDEALWLERKGNKFVKPQPHRNDDCVRILYMGTRTHVEDLEMIRKAYQKVKEDYGKTVILEVVGGVPHGMRTFGEIISVEGINPEADGYHNFVSWIRKENRWDFGIIPLAPTDFNRKKSYIKFLDYSALGLASICSDIEPYREVVEDSKNGILVSNDTEAWYKAIKRLIEDTNLRSRLAEKAFHDLTQKHLLEVNAKKHLGVYQEVLGNEASNLAASKSLEFYEACYLSQNPDVARAVKDGIFTSARHHWDICGYKEVAAGLRLYRPGVILGDGGQRSFSPAIRRQLRIEVERWSLQPLISVIMPVYNVDKKWLDKAVQSVKNQIYPHWELCIADDSSTNKETIDYLKSLQDERVKIKFLKENQGISGASNEAISLAQGAYIALLDNDDELTEDALYEVAKVINEHQPDLIYSDEDKITLEGELVGPYFKPDYSPDLVLSNNYICHLGVYRKSIVDEIGGFRKGFEGSQDHDLLLRFLEKSEKVCHIPKILYHWRKIPGSTADNYDSKSYAWEAGRKALQEAMQRRSIKAQAEFGPNPGTYRIRREILNEPLVSIIIPFKDKPEVLQQCIDSILDKSTYHHFEIIGISNNSIELETDKLMQHYEKLDRRIKFHEYNIPFNFSAINNYAVTLATGEHLVLLNNDIEIISPDWIEALLEHSQRPEVGAVGGKLYFPNDAIQHAGVIIGVGGIAAHSHKYLPKETAGYFCRPVTIGNVCAVTAACLMIKKSIYEEVEGLEEKYLKVAFNDVDFCLRIMEKGYLNIYTPYCEAYHHESLSRGHEDTPEKKARFAAEIKYIKKRHAEILRRGDPYYNPNLSLDSGDFGISRLFV